MLSFIRALRRDRAFLAHLPGLILALLIAETFYKFHSFTLECIAFLATWLLIDVVLDRLLGREQLPKTMSDH